MICKIAMELGFHDSAYAVRDSDLIKEIFEKRQDADALVLTDRSFDVGAGKIVRKYHCCLALNWREIDVERGPEILLYFPQQVGDPATQWFKLKELEEKLVHFVLLS
jgi:hypothetical protein